MEEIEVDIGKKEEVVYGSILAGSGCSRYGLHCSCVSIVSMTIVWMIEYVGIFFTLKERFHTCSSIISHVGLYNVLYIIMYN